MKRSFSVVEADDEEERRLEERGLEKKRNILYDTFRKWQRDFDKDLKSLTWLDCVTMLQFGKKVVVALRCSVCCRFKQQIESSRNFSDKWILGADSLRTSNIRDHAKTNQHELAMKLLAKEHAIAKGASTSTYAPIVQAMQRMSETEKARLRRKFDIAYLVATEKLSFKSIPLFANWKRNMDLTLGLPTQMNMLEELLYTLLLKLKDKK